MSKPDDGIEPINQSSPVHAVGMESLKEVKCEDVDLLFISCKLTHLSLAVIGECLGLQESQVQDALKKVSEHHQDHNKVHLLLIKWREVNLDKATWGTLIQCMESLPEPEIADKIRDELINNPPSK